MALARERSRTKARTGKPLSKSFRVSSRPTLPVAPVTKIIAPPRDSRGCGNSMPTGLRKLKLTQNAEVRDTESSHDGFSLRWTCKEEGRKCVKFGCWKR